MTTVTDPASERRDRGFVALLLITAGLLMLVGRVVTPVGSGVALALGVEFLVWAVLTRSTGLLVTGGLVTGIGSGVLLAAGPLGGADPNVMGGAYLLSIAGGITVISLLSWYPLRQPQPWSWAAACGIGTIGAALLAGPDVAATTIGWALPVLLIAAGLIATLRRARAR